MSETIKDIATHARLIKASAVLFLWMKEDSPDRDAVWKAFLNEHYDEEVPVEDETVTHVLKNILMLPKDPYDFAPLQAYLQ